MDSSKQMTKPLVLLGFVVFLPLFAFSTPNEPTLDEEAIVKRLERMENPIVKGRYDAVVKSYLTTYLIRRREVAEELLGRQHLYFPVFEEALREKEIPLALKNLAVVESALRPNAVSRAGAVGLWQFMSPTARELGLHITALVDERRDPHRASAAAAVYLRQLYQKFDNWELAIAAYNSGSGRVSRAVKRARSSDYWAIRPFLPRETANYVPAYIAATYLLTYYEKHDLQPRLLEEDLLLNSSILVFQELSFTKIAELTDLPLETIAFLNPAFLQGQIPAHEKGYFLTLPSRTMDKVRLYLESQRLDAPRTDLVTSVNLETSRLRSSAEVSVKLIKYPAGEEETWESIAAAFGVTPEQLRSWNSPATEVPAPGQELSVYCPKDFVYAPRGPRIAPLACLPVMLPQAINAQTLSPLEKQREPLETTAPYLLHTVTKPQTLSKIAIHYPGVTVENLLKLNPECRAGMMLKPGTVLKIKKQ